MRKTLITAASVAVIVGALGLSASVTPAIAQDAEMAAEGRSPKFLLPNRVALLEGTESTTRVVR